MPEADPQIVVAGGQASAWGDPEQRLADHLHRTSRAGRPDDQAHPGSSSAPWSSISPGIETGTPTFKLRQIFPRPETMISRRGMRAGSTTHPAICRVAIITIRIAATTSLSAIGSKENAQSQKPGHAPGDIAVERNR